MHVALRLNQGLSATIFEYTVGSGCMLGSTEVAWHLRSVRYTCLSSRSRGCPRQWKIHRERYLYNASVRWHRNCASALQAAAAKLWNYFNGADGTSGIAPNPKRTTGFEWRRRYCRSIVHRRADFGGDSRWAKQQGGNSRMHNSQQGLQPCHRREFNTVSASVF